MGARDHLPVPEFGAVSGTSPAAAGRRLTGPGGAASGVGSPQDIHHHAVRYPAVMVIVTGSIEARPDTIDRILELGLAHVQRSRLEPGCLLHSIHRDVENELRLVFIEQWEDT